MEGSPLLFKLPLEKVKYFIALSLYGEQMKVTEVSEVEIKTFSIEDISGGEGTVTSAKDFDSLTVQQKLILLGKVKERCSVSEIDIESGSAFERAMNEMYNGKGDVALIIEKRVLTLDKKIQKKAIKGSF